MNYAASALDVKKAKPCMYYVMMNLLDFGGGALEELNVAVADALSMFCQRLVGAVVAAEQHERISRGSPVRLMNEQNTLLAVQHVHRRQTLLEELQLNATTNTSVVDSVTEPNQRTGYFQPLTQDTSDPSIA